MAKPKPSPPARTPTPPARPPAPAAPDPAEARRRRYANLGLGALWVYVAALWLLALSQQFDWGWFGP